ncbi:hypothetical protein ACV4JM_003714 [Salmonella enterica subsp. enterica serovar Altona]|uniref:hypothetical protein n=1 Tax=Enterobacterales TaxID=91347 RepID=UPI000CFAB715|nr:hypothetical protein [Cronobacter sakazakii]EDH7534897.1 hypothetical protein [Salmonella enterica subsp. enterica serovar Typhimurium]ELD6819871.1 hypothetical protein [Enterobacter hormaechei]
MKKRNLNILASLVIALALTGCNESEVDKITLIGQDKKALESQYKTLFEKRTPNIEAFALFDKTAAEGKEPHTTGGLIDGKVESSMTTNVGKYTFMQLDEMLTKEYGKPVATKDQVFDETALNGLECAKTMSCAAGKYYEVFRGKERLIMMINGAGFMNKDEGVTLLTFTDKHLKTARLEEDKRH